MVRGRASSGLTSSHSSLAFQYMSQDRLVPSETSAARLLSRQEAEREDRVFWHSKTPEERLAAAERLRQIAYGHDAATARIQTMVVRTRLKPG
jgi:hypothetical protein